MFGFVFFLAIAMVCYFTIYIKTKDTLHPVAMMTFIWFFMAGVSMLQLGEYQVPWSFETFTVVVISGVMCYFLGTQGLRSIGSSNSVGKSNFEVSHMYMVATRVIFCICFISIIYMLYKNSFFTGTEAKNLASMDRKTASVEYTQIEGRGLNYIISYLPFCALNSIFELLYSNKKKWFYNIFVLAFSIWYIWFVIFSRGTLIIIILGGLFIINSKKKFSILKIFLFCAFVMIIMAFLMVQRLGTESIVFEGATKSALFNSIYNYIAYCFQNLDGMIRDGSPYSIFLNVWQSVYKLLGLYDESMFVHYQTSIYNAETYLAPFYHDLGLIGIILYPGIISFGLSILYVKSKSNMYCTLILASFQKAIFIVFFGNYFLTSLSIMFPYILTIFICVVSERLKIKFPKAG